MSVIPINTGYDWAIDPTQQAEYVNPVVLNNLEIKLANDAFDVSQKIIDIQTEVGNVEIRLKKKLLDLRIFESQLLAENPPKSNDTKSTKLVEAYIWKLATEANKLDEYKTLLTSHAALLAKVDDLKNAIEIQRNTLNSIRLVGEHIQTHLSYVKSEMKSTRVFG